jgi:hypothetical protein
MEYKLKEYIIERYGSINNFLETTDIKISRSQVYYILNQGKNNITLESIREFSRVLELKEQQIIYLLLGYIYEQDEKPLPRN